MRVFATLAGIGGGLALVLGACVAGISAQPGAALRQVQQLMIDGGLGAPTRIGSGDQELYTWTYGPTTGPTVVLVHGFGDAGAGWVQVAQSLGKMHRVVVVDLPGHGRSGPRAAPITFEALADGMDRALAQVDGPVVLVGNSLGGWLSARYALRHPDRVSDLVLVNNAGMETELDESLLLPKTRARMRDKNRAVMGDHAPEMPDFVLDGLIALHQDPRLAALYREIRETGPYLDGDLAKVQPDTHLVWGTPDPFFPVQGYLDGVRAERPEADVVMLDGCGHAPQYSCPDAVAQAIADIAKP